MNNIDLALVLNYNMTPYPINLRLISTSSNIFYFYFRGQKLKIPYKNLWKIIYIHYTYFFIIMLKCRQNILFSVIPYILFNLAILGQHGNI